MLNRQRQSPSKKWKWLTCYKSKAAEGESLFFAKDFSGHPARKISKNHATANAFGCPDSSCYARFNPARVET